MLRQNQFAWMEWALLLVALFPCPACDIQLPLSNSELEELNRRETNCGNDLDGDRDGLTDCADPDCNCNTSGGGDDNGQDGVKGACCAGTTCSLTTRAACDAASATYQGDGTTCDNNPCALPSS